MSDGIAELINSIGDGDKSKAEDQFKTAMNGKLADILTQRTVDVGQSMMSRDSSQQKEEQE
jgi:hypothetical protein